MPDARIVRMSALFPAGRRCRATLATEEQAKAELGLPVEDSNTASQLGSAFHQLVAEDAKAPVQEGRVRHLAKEYGVPYPELNWLWSRLDPGWPGRPIATWVEERVELPIAQNLQLAGTLDRAALYEGGHLIVDDFKTGRIDASEQTGAGDHDQLIGYGVAMWHRLQMQGEAVSGLTLRLVSPRIGDRVREETFDMEEIPYLRQRVIDLAIAMDSQREIAPERRHYTTGDHCRWCRGRAICRAYQERMGHAVALVQPGLVDESKLPRTKAGAISKKALAAAQKEEIAKRIRQVIQGQPRTAWELSRMARQAGEMLTEALKEHVSFYGPLEIEEGYELRMNPYRTRGSLSISHVREACKWLEVDEETTEKLLDALENRPELEAERFGRYKKAEP